MIIPGGWQLRNRHRSHAIAERLALSPMTVSNEKPGHLVPWERLSDLLGGPLCCRVSGSAETHNTPSFMAQDKEHKLDLECDGGHDKEIDRSGAIQVVAEECLPALIGIRGTADYIFGHGRLTYLEAELEDFSVDAGRAPQRIFRAHPPDQRPMLIGRLWPSSAGSQLPPPLDPEPSYDASEPISLGARLG